MTLDEIAVNGLIALAILISSIFLYVWREKTKYLQEKKIEAYSAFVCATSEFLIAMERDTNERREKTQDLNKAISSVLFYGSDKIYKKIPLLFKEDVDHKTRIKANEFKELVIAMILEIDSKRTVKAEEVFGIWQ